jgi:hypothetical protein
MATSKLIGTPTDRGFRCFGGSGLHAINVDVVSVIA